MTDDLTKQYDANPGGDPPTPTSEPTPASEPAAGPDAAPAADPGPGAASAAATMPIAATATAGASRTRWLAALGIAGVAIVAAVAALLLFGKSSTPEALSYIPGDAAMVIELRPELPGDQMQAVGNLLAHFPGFQDQSTLADKIDLALKRLITEAPGSSVDYEKDVKPFLGGPMFVSIRSFDEMAANDAPTNVVVVATTNGAITCESTFDGESVTTETYNGVTVSTSSSKQAACAVDGRFFLAGDPAGVKAAIDTRKAANGMDKSATYQAARTQLGLDRLATLYVDGAAFGKALGTASPPPGVADMVNALPKWVMAGVRAENDALLMDMVIAPAANPSAQPSIATFPPVHPIALTAFAPADTLAFAEIQGFGVSIHNVVAQLQSDPQFSEALKALDTFGGLDGLIGWVSDGGFVVFKDGDSAAGGILLTATDAAAASEKLTAVTTVLGLAAAGGGIEVSTSTIEGVKVTNVHIADASALTGAVGGGVDVPAVPVDFSIAAKDRYVILGIGTNAMSKMLGVKAGSGLADDAAFKRAIARGLANPQAVVYVAAGASIDWIESAGSALGTPAMPVDLKAYLDPVEGFIYTVVGDGLHGSFRIALTVGTP